MSEQPAKFNFSPPSVTNEEAEHLFRYHLMMAAKLFELLPEGYTFPENYFDEFTLDAAKDFLAAMEDAYDTAPDPEDAEC